MKDNTKVLIFSTIAVIIIILFAVGATYAYFEFRTDNDANIDITTNVTSQTNVEYNPGNSIELKNAEPGAKKETIFNIELSASDQTKDTITYGIDWVIDENTFVYESSAPNDAQLTYSLYYSLDNQSWETFVENADCTTWLGTKTIASNQQLSADANTTNQVYWKFIIEYKSYNYNQASNMAKVLNGTLKMTGLE